MTASVVDVEVFFLGADLFDNPNLLTFESIVAAARIYGGGVGLKMCGVITKPFSQADLLTALGLPV